MRARRKRPRTRRHVGCPCCRILRNNGSRRLPARDRRKLTNPRYEALAWDPVFP